MRYQIVCMTAAQPVGFDEAVIGIIVADNDEITQTEAEQKIHNYIANNDLSRFTKVEFILRQFRNVNQWEYSFNHDLDRDGHPNKAGIYELWGNGSWDEIEVYEHPLKGLCVFTGQGGGDANDCHQSVRFWAGAVFGKRLRDADRSD